MSIMADKMESKENHQSSPADYENGSIEVIGDTEWTTEEETAVRRKFDLTITPLVTLLYMLCAIDR